VEHKDNYVEAADGISLHVDRWEPDAEARFVVVISHGHSEHMGRWAPVAERLARRGGLVFGPDHRGEGRSQGPRGHVDGFETYAADLLRVMRFSADGMPADRQPRSTPWFLLGHSMGGLIALVYLLEHGREFPLRGAIISSPLLSLTQKPGALADLLGTVAGRVLPTFSRATGGLEERISRDPEVVARYAADPRRTRVVTAGWYAAMKRAAARVGREVQALELPMLWYAGTGDLICDYGVTKRVVGRLTDAEARDQSFETFEGYYHECHNEPPELREPVLRMLETWIDERVAP
jgi:alpha-beta hydrolase superfamily lysophospholipase